ncbi:histidine ammonia-lyase [Pseudoroseomonas wenyumeiae]|uniref:Histidine ammonia-lyase n=1 Tax=Teichococcus wenyumeiae TaxID=2478470 RepID=A0A3A9JFL4_9PROT|nr:histidine ammonia-lyase [Pseudoroseomonas wenyumeiae]RKK06127.1 histidine ammonia-lyase [Pseudoroseomonas wenyumeiae]RMI25616.1 histidine ammonia-lyase [Pseudoroseomonas wenyumeiae]
MIVAPGSASLENLQAIMQGEVLDLPAGWQAPVEASVGALAKRIEQGEALYGVNTGFGKLASQRIGSADLAKLQLNLLRSHASGTGALLPAPVVRLILALKAMSLARGASAVRPVVIEALLALLRADVLPAIPAKGSVGASGDLAPLAHLSLVLIGEGEAMVGGAVVPGAEALRRAGIAPLALGPKEGLALLNGTQVSTALALAGLFTARMLLRTALASGAMSVDAARGSDTPFDPRIHALRGQPGQIRAAAALRNLLEGSAIRESHRTGDTRVQDPYCLRCQPQVMGACIDQLDHAAQVLQREANAVTDNPLVTAEGEVLSGGNFHAEPVAFAADNIALAVAEIGALAERRIALLTDPALSGLPAFLVREGGLNSGFMIAQVTAAALASENKSLAHPRSVDSLPTSANQEDHVSMATGAALRLVEMADNTAGILAIELLAAAQGIGFHRPLTSSPVLEAALALVREQAAPWDEDRLMAPDIAAVKRLVERGAFAQLAEGI